MGFRLRPDDLYRIDVALTPAVSPDDSAVAFVVRRPNPVSRKSYLETIRILSLSREVSSEEIGVPGARCRCPRWSPDGSRLAFLAPDSAGTDQVWLWDRDSREPRVVTHIGRGVIQMDWAPDGRRMVVCAAIVEASTTDTGKSDLVTITTIREKVESQRTWLPSDRVHQQLLVIDVERGETNQITTGPWIHTQPVWSPVRDEIAFVANRTEDPDSMVMADIWVVDAGGGAPRKLTDGKGPFGSLRWSPDGETLAAIGHEYERGLSYQNFMRVWTIKRDGSGKLCRTQELDATCSDCAISDLREFGGHDPGALAWSAWDKRLYFLASIAGTTQLMDLDLSTGRVTPLTSGDQEVYALATMNRSSDVIIAVSTPTVPCNLWWYKRGGEHKRLTSLNAWLSDAELASLERTTTESADGHILDGWVMKPVGFVPGRVYPAVMQVHRLMFAATFFFECQLLAAAGFVVFFMNQHGSFGYGQAFALEDWGRLELDDLVRGARTVAELPYVDSKHLGICGGSNGGHLTYRLLSTSSIFAAGVAQRGITHFASFYGSSDIGYHWTEWILGGPPWVAPDAYREISPLFSADRIRAPLLIVHGDRDTRVPIEQAEAMFVALKTLGRTVAMARFREEGHDLSRTGKPYNRVARLQAIIDWFRLYLDHLDAGESD